MTILDRIAAYKREEIAVAKARVPLDDLKSKIRDLAPPRGFRKTLEAKKTQGHYGLIAEIKKASPSKGIIRDDFDIAGLADAYREGGAACLSVLTDKPSFHGDLSYLSLARSVSGLPALRKDFMLDPYQVAEARVYNADCILVIMAMVNDREARALIEAACEYGMDVLVEVHDEAELDRALALGATMIGINNRDLRTFHTDLAVTLRLAPRIPGNVLTVAESGISTPDDLSRLAGAGVTTFLVGESLMREADIAAATRRLLSANMDA